MAAHLKGQWKIKKLFLTRQQQTVVTQILMATNHVESSCVILIFKVKQYRVIITTI